MSRRLAAFLARYPGRCAAACGSAIEPGDAVAYVDDELAHEACALEPPAPPRPERPGCPSCWLVHAGECL